MHTETTGRPFLASFAAGYPLVMNQFEQGCCAMPCNSQVVSPLSSNQSYMCQTVGPHDLCVYMSSRSPRVCACWKTPALLPGTKPAAWDADAFPGERHREETFICIT